METQQTDMTDPRREVGGIEAFFRGLGQSYANAGRTLAAAGSAPFVLADKAASAITGHPITGAEDLAFDILKPAFEAPKYYQIDPQKEVIKSRAARVGNVAGNAVGTVQQMAAMPGGAGLTGFRAVLTEGAPALARLAAGAVPGTITRAAPAIVPPAIDTEQHILDAGGSTGTALKGALATAGTNAALSFLPVSMPGSWLTRGLTGGAIGAAGTVPQAGIYNWALGDDPNVQDLKQPLLDPAAMGHNALVQGLMGVIGGRTPDVPVSNLVMPFIQKAEKLFTREPYGITSQILNRGIGAIQNNEGVAQLSNLSKNPGQKSSAEEFAPESLGGIDPEIKNNRDGVEKEISSAGDRKESQAAGIENNPSLASGSDLEAQNVPETQVSYFAKPGDIVELAANVHTNPWDNTRRALAYAPVSRAATEMFQNLGIDVSGYQHMVDNSGIRHTFIQHGQAGTELPRGQEPVTPEDFGNLPDVIANPDTVELAGKTKQGRETIQYRKRINGHIIVVEEARTGKKRLALVSMWKVRARSDAQPD